MMKLIRIFWLLVAFFSGGLSFAAELDGLTGPRPADGIYDPNGWIFGPPRNSLTRELESVRESSGLDVLVVVLEKLGNNEPQMLAEALATRWGYHGGRALILYVPENAEGPWIAVGGLIRSEIPPATLDPIIEKARKRARSDVTVHGAVYRAVESLGDDLRFASGRTARGIQQVANKQRPPGIKDLIYLMVRNFKKILLAIAAVVLILCLAGYSVFWVWRKARLSLTPKTFPEISWKPRFGAPHAGIVYTHSMKKKVPRTNDP